MRVEAIKTDEGVFIPLLDQFKKIRRKKILLDVTIVNDSKSDRDEVDIFFAEFNINFKKHKFNRDEANER
jgi:hypothetical protein